MASPALDIRDSVARALHQRDRHLAILRSEESAVPTWSLLPEPRREEYRSEADAALAAITEIRKKFPQVDTRWVEER